MFYNFPHLFLEVSDFMSPRMFLMAREEVRNLGVTSIADLYLLVWIIDEKKPTKH